MNTPVPAGSLRPTRTGTRTLRVGPIGPVEVTLQDRDRTRPFLLLHGGGGVATMAGFADLLTERTQAYVALLEQLDLADVTVIGNSFGGWLAAEIALRQSPRVSGAVIVDGMGITVEGHPMIDVRGLSPAEIQAYSWHDPSKAP